MGIGTRVGGSAALSLVTGATPLRPEPALFEAMLAGWRCQQQSRRLSESMIGSRERTVRRFAGFTGGWPWCWNPAQLESWTASGGWAHSTVRSYQGALGCFLDYVCDPRYGWVSECEQQVGARPGQIVHADNSAVHVADYEGRPARRPLTRVELQALFDAADDRVEQIVTAGRKGWLAAFRDATLFKVCYAFGLRRRELAMLDVADFTANPAAPALGGLGICQVRYGKAMRGSPPRRRAVAAVMPWAVEALAQYLGEVRPRYGAAAHPALWLTERGGRISARQVDDRFALWRTAAGLPVELSVHSLRRHLFITDAVMHGMPPHIAQLVAGHRDINTTMGYKHADMTAKQTAMDRTTPTGTGPGRYRPTDDQLLAFLQGL